MSGSLAKVLIGLWTHVMRAFLARFPLYGEDCRDIKKLDKHVFTTDTRYAGESYADIADLIDKRDRSKSIPMGQPPLFS